MNIIHLISGLRRGGAEHFILSLCTYSKNDKQIRMSVFSLSGADEISRKFRDEGIEVIMTAEAGTQTKKTNAWRAVKLLLKGNADIYHAHMFHACMIACMLKIIRPSMRIVFTLHNNHVPQIHRRLLLFFTRPLRKKDIVFKGMSRRWYQKPGAAMVINGINVEKFAHRNDVKPPVFTCAFAGRLEYEKNPLFLVTLAKTLSPDFDFIIKVAGEGSLKSELNQSIQQAGLKDRFHIIGDVDDMTSFLATSHCLVLPSLWEGMPMILLEGAAAGIPVITTPVGSVPSIVNHTNGYIGKLDQFPNMLREVMNNYGDALIRARKLMTIVNEQYDISQSYRQYLDIYRQL